MILPFQRALKRRGGDRMMKNPSTLLVRQPAQQQEAADLSDEFTVNV